MQQLNEIQLRGRVGSAKISEYKGKKFVKFTLCTQSMYEGNDGCIVIDCSWHNITAWANKNMPDFENIKANSGVYVKGSLRYQRFTTSDGLVRNSCEIVANEMEIVE